MPLYTRLGGILTRSGALASSASCCCGSLPECFCAGTPKTVPSAVTLGIDIGNVFSDQGGPCSDTDFRNYWNGTYTISYTRSVSGIHVYEATYSDGRFVEVYLTCNGIPTFTAVSCNLSLCYRRSGQFYSFGTGTPGICAAGTGTYALNDFMPYDRPWRCNDSPIFNGKKYYVVFTLGYIW
jgi:hypothetical protein